MKHINFTHQLVRDLYWMIASPSPIRENGVDGLRIFPALWKHKLLEQHIDWFQHLDKNPQLLENWIAQTKSSRLGIYAEKLMYYFFDQSPLIDLKLCNYQVIKSKKTIGEIDFVIGWEERIIHIELAVKYYLDAKEDDVFSNWIGPSGNDNLKLKIDKVLNHQLPLSQTNQFRQETNLWTEPYFWLNGIFFTNALERPNWMAANVVLGNYLRWSEWIALNLNLRDYQVILRPSWMMDTVLPQSQFVKELPNNQDALYTLLHQHGALLLRRKHDALLAFLVQDVWPNLS